MRMVVGVNFLISVSSLTTARISFLLLLFFILNLCTQPLNGDKNLLKLHEFRWDIKHNPSCFSPKSSRKENGATILEMKHKDYCSGPIKDWNQRLQTRIIFDNYRVQSIQSRHMKKVRVQDISKTQTQIPLTSGIKLQTLNYIVTVQLGGKNMTLIVDTGSDLTWVQCQPCKMCYNQQAPIFDPSLSNSYKPIPCNSPPCRSLLFATGKYAICAGTSSCNYYVSYGDGSYTGGDLATERIDLGATPVEDFVFGCGRNNKGLFGGASGLMGLGRSELSLVSQTNSIFGGGFSYCLPSSEAESSGSLTFGGGGDSVFRNSTPISYTRMVQNPLFSSFYFLNLTGVSVGGVNLQSPTFGTSGVLIDSGTVITRLPPSIYTAIKIEFLNQFSGIPTAPGFSILDICFNLSGYREVNIPTLRMEFDGGTKLEVDVMGMFYFVRSDSSQVCLALASLMYEDEIPILGNFQQRNTRVVYDTAESRLGFARESCGYA